MKPLNLSSPVSPPIRRRWLQELEEARIPRPAWTGNSKRRCIAARFNASKVQTSGSRWNQSILTPDARHDLLRRRDLTLFHGLHPRLLSGGPRLSLPPRAPASPRPSIPCRALATDRLPNTCTRQGKHVCEDEREREEEVEEEAKGEELSHSPSPPSSEYQQAELGAKHKGWSARAGRCSRPYSRDSSTDSGRAESQSRLPGCSRDGEFRCQEREEYLPCKDADYDSLERDISPK